MDRGKPLEPGQSRPPRRVLSLSPHGLTRIQLAAVPPGLPYYYGTPRGWLALADDEQSPMQLVLWEPHSCTEIQLPPLDRVIQVFLSGDPLASSSSSWMAIATQVSKPYHNDIFFWRPGDDAWTPAAEVFTGKHLDSVAFLRIKMYCIDSSLKLAIYDLNLGTRSPPVLLQRMYLDRQLSLLCNRRCGRHLHGTRAAHFVACNGEMLLVVLFYERHPSFAEVYKADLLTHNGRDLVLGERVTDLGGHSLFLGRGDAFALSAEKFPAIKRNCVYYAVHCRNTYKKDWVFVFDLESDVLDEFPFPPQHKENPENEWWPVSWFCPRRPLFLEQR